MPEQSISDASILATRSNMICMKALNPLIIACFTVLLFMVPVSVMPFTQISPPIAQQVEQVTVIHGDRRVDPYAWMKDRHNPQVMAYLEAENRYTDELMQPLEPLQQTLYQEMLGRIQQTDLSVPYRFRGYYYYSRTEEGKQYPIFSRSTSLNGPEERLLDGNAEAAGKEFWSLAEQTVSDNGQFLVWTTDTTGYRQYTLRVKNLQSGALLPIQQERVTSVVWAADNQTLFFTTEDTITKRSDQLWRWRLEQNQPELIYEESDPRFNIAIDRTRSQAYLLLNIGSLTTSEVRFLRADQPDGQFQLIESRYQGIEYDVDHRGDQFWIRVNDTGRNFRLVTAPIQSPDCFHWREVVPHRATVMLEGILLFENFAVRYEREKTLPQLTVMDLHHNETYRISFPEAVYIAFPSNNAEFDTTILRYSYQSFVTPPSIYDYDLTTRSATLLKQTEVLGGYDPGQYTIERLYAPAPDGVEIPISLVYRKDVAHDGTAPLYLGGYGAYGISVYTGFSSSRLSLLDRGVVMAWAHVRGGGDLGKTWHDDGRMFKKQNSFTDFIAVAEYLLAHKYGAKDRFVIEGGSAGGLLMGAVANMRPDLFHAVILQVPFLDVINTMLDDTLPLTVGEFEEWGNPHNQADYDYIKTYCPYTNIAAKAYPTMLVKTSLNDSQVLFHEPTKYVAKMRATRRDNNPLLFKVNMAAGHGGASGRFDRLHEVAFDYAFMLWQMGLVKDGAYSSPG